MSKIVLNKGVHHNTTLITWVKQVAERLPDADDPETLPQVGELDELETFVRSKKIWLWTVVDHFKSGILGWVLGDHSAKTFRSLWGIVAIGNAISTSRMVGPSIPCSFQTATTLSVRLI